MAASLKHAQSNPPEQSVNMKVEHSAAVRQMRWTMAAAMRGLLGATGVVLCVFTLLCVFLYSAVHLCSAVSLSLLCCISASALGLVLFVLHHSRVRTFPPLVLLLQHVAVWEWRNKWRTAKNDQIAQLSFAVGQEIASRAAGGTSSTEVVQLKADYAKLTVRYEQAIDSAADAQRGNLEAIGNAVKVCDCVTG